MKLYTEEQVNEIFNRVKMISEEHKHEHIINHLSKDLTPIGLPSDEEIEKGAWEIYWEKYPKNMFSNGSRPDLVIGYVRFYRELKEQILNQNKS